jgi:hypothetical protein
MSFAYVNRRPSADAFAVRSAPSLFAALLLTAAVAAQESRPIGPPPAGPAVSVPSFPNATCPIMGKPASLKLFVDTEFGRVYTCCAPCNRKIRADPAGTYRLSYPKTEKLGNKTCPVSGKPVGASTATVLLQGREIALCSADCVRAAREDAQAVLALASDPTLVDLRNTHDPANGKPVVRNLVVVIGGCLVRLAAAESMEDVRKDPRVALERAKASAPVRADGPDSRPAPAKPPVAPPQRN